MGLMGSYLKKPLTEKESLDESNDKLSCGASSMQGWRVSQEDAHNCMLDFDKETSLFAVYDGHGGHEVAEYCSQKLPEFLKECEAYKKNEFSKALEDAFLGFDATLLTKDVLELLNKMAKSDLPPEAESDEDVENVKCLYEEASMPIEAVIEKYTSNLDAALKSMRKDHAEKAEKAGKSENNPCSSTSSNLDVVSSTSCNDAPKSPKKEEASGDAPSTNTDDEKPVKAETETNSPDSSGDKCDSGVVTTPVNHQNHQNGDLNNADCVSDQKNDVSSSSATVESVENGEVVKKGKGKATTKTKGVVVSNKKVRPKRSVNQMYADLLKYKDDGSEEESEDEEDLSFKLPNDENSDDDDDDDDDEGVNTAIEMENSSSEEDGENDDEDDSEDDDDEDEDLEYYDDYDLKGDRGPVYNSGCTAVVALLHQNQLFVANAGDSRCIVCRNGKAIEMSIDHKPEDKPERDRIEKAGGHVSMDGRVNGGLNLSRAIGDHSSKRRSSLSDREQMITALPDIRTLTINPSDDEFMVLACDGIWNVMSSQEVVDFVRPLLKEGKSLSKICEEMFDHCLADDTLGDGTGCDNMTCIIVQFKPAILKRTSSSDIEEADNKRTKTDEDDLSTTKQQEPPTSDV